MSVTTGAGEVTSGLVLNLDATDVGLTTTVDVLLVAGGGGGGCDMGGGGGAGGPLGSGGKGYNGSYAAILSNYGGAGGGNGGGTDGSAPTGILGGNGGNNASGIGGGIAPAGSGSFGGGGAGSYRATGGLAGAGIDILNTIGSGGGGGVGSQTRVLMPACLCPDELQIVLGLGGAGGAADLHAHPRVGRAVELEHQHFARAQRVQRRHAGHCGQSRSTPQLHRRNGRCARAANPG